MLMMVSIGYEGDGAPSYILSCPAKNMLDLDEGDVNCKITYHVTPTKVQNISNEGEV